ncbi:MAG: hypothetical protein ABIH99_01170, partial [Candidatus Micrarchaeota archaeon]
MQRNLIAARTNFQKVNAQTASRAGADRNKFFKRQLGSKTEKKEEKKAPQFVVIPIVSLKSTRKVEEIKTETPSETTSRIHMPPVLRIAASVVLFVTTLVSTQLTVFASKLIGAEEEGNPSITESAAKKPGEGIEQTDIPGFKLIQTEFNYLSAPIYVNGKVVQVGIKGEGSLAGAYYFGLLDEADTGEYQLIQDGDAVEWVNSVRNLMAIGNSVVYIKRGYEGGEHVVVDGEIIGNYEVYYGR